ncbi:PHD finger family protein [Artemisia annua]|uniref:PHD finger family protein n=1 Tax=Artemisia annua TaxID=35608 RepID=A0A2U1Q0B5_ARTAN|nr:PHD finger family protein [Artemisia annua]
MNKVDYGWYFRGNTQDVTGEEQVLSNGKVMCRLCFSGEYERTERARRILSCKSCNKKYHRSCLKAWSNDIDFGNWYCDIVRMLAGQHHRSDNDTPREDEQALSIPSSYERRTQAQRNSRGRQASHLWTEGLCDESRCLRSDLSCAHSGRMATNFNRVLDDVSITGLTFGWEFIAAIEGKQVVAQEDRPTSV